MYLNFLKNHVIANLTFIIVLIIGAISYLSLPRQQDPDINFNWIIISTLVPGASASDVELKVTNPIEDALNSLSHIKFISSNSRENISSLLIRFNQIDERIYDKHLAEIRREIQNLNSILPESANDPLILEIISANAFPAAMIAVTGHSNDEDLRLNAYQIRKDLKRMKGVDRVDEFGLNKPELLINFIPEKLQQFGVKSADIADSIRVLLEDKSLGKQQVKDKNWLIRIIGQDKSVAKIAQLPILTHQGFLPLSLITEISNGRKTASELVSVNKKPAILLSIMKQSGENTLDLIDRIHQFVKSKNSLIQKTGIKLILVNDQSEITTNAINIMQTNALYGLIFVLIITFIFLGFKISFITTMGIPFILAGTFWALTGLGQTLNVSVLLAVVIALGMLVDDAVVVAEAIYYRVFNGEDRHTAVISALKEVVAPVTTAVLTTMAAFLPLMLLPGILGDFMRVIPLVVTIALLISLVEAFWMLPAHALGMNLKTNIGSANWRERFTHSIRLSYSKILIKVLRFSKSVLLLVLILFGTSIYALTSGIIKMDFFASDSLRMFYINLEMPAATTLEQSLNKIETIEQKARSLLNKEEYREIVSYSGAMFTETEPRLGNKYAQILVGLTPKQPHMRSVEKVIKDLDQPIKSMLGNATSITFLKLAGGPPVTKPISVKVRGDSYEEIREASNALIQYLETIESVSNIVDDADVGSPQLSFKIRYQDLHMLKVSVQQIQRTLQYMFDGEVISSYQHNGETINIRLRSKTQHSDSLNSILQTTVINSEGQAIPLSQVVIAKYEESIGNIRHYNFKRSITIEADIDKKLIDEVTVNNLVKEYWKTIQNDFPNVNLDFSGILDDIEESLNSIIVLFIFGVGLMYLILGTQFKSYFQPMMILATVPLAFIGVVLGVIITKHPMSLYTLYGIVALAGIAVNSAIVLISTANQKLRSGYSLTHATVYASRRRVIPIVITTLTTIGGLLSLALGLGGESLIWGPVANAIVWGLGVSATLTLFVIPILYGTFMRFSNLSDD